MPENTLETTVSNATRTLSIDLNSPVGYAVTTLALIGGRTVTVTAIGAVKKINRKRKARQAVAEASEPKPQS